MNTRRSIIVGCALAVLAGLLISTSAPVTLADFPASEHYRLVASEVENAPAVVQPACQVSNQRSEHYHLVASGIGDAPIAMESDFYTVNEGIVLQAEVAPAMESENYRAGGEVPRKVYLPLVLRGSE